MPSIRANDLEVGYEVEGDGPPLILLHGASSGGRLDFGPQVARLRGQFTCYLPDARGHGATPADPATFSYPALLADVVAFADALALPSFHLAGFSMGGGTALGVASRWPARVRSLVVAGISPQREPRASVARRLFDPDRIKRTDPAWAATLDARHDPVQGEDGWERLLPVIAGAIASADLLEPADLRRITAPTLVIVGDADPFVPVDHAWGLKRQLRDARLLVVPDCGHEVTVRRPALVNEALAAFYRSVEAAAGHRAAAQPAQPQPEETPR